MKESSHLDYILFLDSDMGVVNPKRRIEEFLDENAEVIFYDRFYNWEVMAGSYLIKNSNWSRTFLQGFADYEFRLPKSFHGMDNGAIHAYLAEHALPHNHEIVPICMDIYNHSKGYDDLFLYEACIRTALGNSTLSGKIKILPKGTAWVRDNWMTNSKWNEERDFMIHNWKTTQLRTYSTLPIPYVFFTIF
uniref:Glycosyltransferase family 92 protein n=1 Tax=Angiostrongylus cantonensis TaxID=6313 RepID=A0A0K0DK13_ANGCA